VEEHLVHQKKPRDARLAELAQGFELQLRWDEAGRLWRQLLRLAPGSRRLLLSAARAEMMAGREEDAIRAIDEYVCDGPSCADTPRRAARALLAAGANQPALALARKAVERRPEDPLGRFLAAVAAMQMGERDLESERRYLSLAADSDQARIFLARRLLFSGRAPSLGSPQPPRAWIDDARNLLAIPPNAQGDPPEARLWRLVADASQGAPDAAERLTQALPRLPPAFKTDPLDDRAPTAQSPPPKNAALVADILLREGATEPADTALRLWVARSEKPAATLHQGAFEMARNRGSGPLMKRWLDELDRRYPDHHAKVTLLAEALEASGDHDGAEATYRQALARSPRAGVYMNNLAYLFSRRRRDLEEGLRLVRYAEQLQPVSNKFYYDTEGWVLYRLGRLEEARARIWASIRLMNAAMGPTVSESFFHLGSVSADLGRQSEAHWAFRTAAVLDPWGEYGRRSAQALRQMSGETPNTQDGKSAN
jgi:Flp pilus assembly protein TadD